MRRPTIAPQILLILSIFNFVLAAPVATPEINEVRDIAVDGAKVRMAVSEKRMEPGDEWSTNAAYLTDEEEVTWNTISSDSTASSSFTSDTATSGPPSIGSPPRPTDDPPSHSGLTGNPSLWPSVSTNQPPQSPRPAPDNSPPSSPQPESDNSHPTPSNPGTSTGSHQLADDHSPPNMESQHPGVPESEKFFSELMKGKIRRRTSGHGPGNVVQGELQGTVGPSAYVSSPSLFCQRSKHPSNKHSDLPLLNC
jgi:hypothetical protein